MAIKSDYIIQVKMYNNENDIIYSYETTAFRPCQQDLKFSAIQAGLFPNNGYEPDIHVIPLWKKNQGKPFCEGFKVSAEKGNAKFAKNYSLEILNVDIFRQLNEMKKKGIYSNDSVQINYSVCAYPKTEDRNKDNSTAFSSIKVKTHSKPLQVQKRDIDEFEGKIIGNKAKSDKNILPVFVKKTILQNISEHCLINTLNEQAGLILGKLYFDSKRKKYFIVCASSLEAKVDKCLKDITDKHSSISHFNFTPELFFSLQQQVFAKSDELILGWYHSHPWIFNKGVLSGAVLNKNGLNSVFFSIDDQVVQDTAFSLPYQVAIVFGGIKKNLTSQASPAVQMFGWLNGLVVPRNFYSI